jgi:hypothetical protein
MDDLRWALLGLGLLFVGGLAWWELRKPRHAGRDEGFEASGAPDSHSSRRVEPRFGDGADGPPVPDSPLPSMRAVETGDPPVLMLDDVTDGRGSVEISIVSDVAIDEPRGAVDPDEAPPFDVPTEAAVLAPQPSDFDPSAEIAPVARRPGPPQPNWPPEDQRRIVSLRVVPRPPARFNGRSLRHAFEGSGLEHGAFDIFHLVDHTGEVIASAANLMRPGTFVIDSMDGSHFHGVHLFCVLPGPLPAGRAVDELIALARDLAQRVSGIVLDGVGQPLDEERAAAVRDEAVAAERAG